MATNNRILKNFSFLTIALLVGQGCSFAALIYLARVLGATNFGKINFALAILNYFILFTTMGMPVLGAREVARDKSSINKFVSNIITIQLVLSLISFALIVAISLLIDKPTDVLSFALMERKYDDETPFITPPDGVLHLGEVVISYPQAAKQAEDNGLTLEKELSLLIVHGVLHLLGYEHDKPDREREMRALEEKVLSELEKRLK